MDPNIVKTHNLLVKFIKIYNTELTKMSEMYEKIDKIYDMLIKNKQSSPLKEEDTKVSSGKENDEENNDSESEKGPESEKGLDEDEEECEQSTDNIEQYMCESGDEDPNIVNKLGSTKEPPTPDGPMVTPSSATRGTRGTRGGRGGSRRGTRGTRGGRGGKK